MANTALMYYGSKSSISSWIIGFFPPHDTFVDIMGGSAAVLLAKEQVKLEVYNDLNHHLVNFFKVLREQPEELVRLIGLTPYARQEHEVCRHPCDDPLESARRFFCSSWMGISGMPHDKKTGMRTLSHAGQRYTSHPKSMRQAQERLHTISERIRYTQIECKQWDEILARYDRDKTLIYFDPPYVKSTRTAKNMYHYEWDDDLHMAAAEKIKQADSYVVVSGYESDLYSDLYNDWPVFSKTMTANAGTKRTERLWLSPKTHKALLLAAEVGDGTP